MADVLISYVPEDQEFVRWLCGHFVADGREVWVDFEGIPPSAEFMAEIRAAIDAADAVLFVMSPGWINSTVGQMELEHAVAAGKRLVPVVHRPVPTEDVPDALRALN